MWKTEIIGESNLENFLNNKKIKDFKVIDVIKYSHLEIENQYFIAYKI